MKTFNEVFRNVSDPVWNVIGGYYEAFYVNADKGRWDFSFIRVQMPACTYSSMKEMKLM